MKTILKLLAVKIILWILGVALALALLTLGVLNIAKFVLYADYYGIKTDVCTNPGLSDGFACQGICADEASERILVSGYMADHSASRIYVTDEKNQSYYVTLTQSGKAFTGHVGGIALHGNTVYLANDGRLHLLSLQALLTAEDGSSVDVGTGIEVNNQASFAYANDQYVYVGEFHNGDAYVTDHPYNTPDGMNYAIVSRYTHGDLTRPDRIYSIRNEVQGFCVTPDGQMVLSTSYGLADSHYYIYDESKAMESGELLDGVPVYYLINCEKEIKGPAMAEGLAWYDGKVITLTESASNKYIFGKFFFADKIVALDLKK